MLTDEAKRFLRNWRTGSVNGVLLFGVDEAAKAGLVTWAGLLTPRGADLVATAEAAGYDPDAVEIKCDACQDTGSIREWVDVPIMGEWTVTRERARPCEECDAQAEADRAMIESGILSPDEIRLMRGQPPTAESLRKMMGDVLNFKMREVEGSIGGGHLMLDTSGDPIMMTPRAFLGHALPPGQSDMDLYAQMVMSYKRESRLGWADAMTIDPFAGSASTTVPAAFHSRPARDMWANGETIAHMPKFRPHAEPFTFPEPSAPPRTSTAEALANLALTPEPEAIDVPPPVDWNYLDSMRDR